MQGRILRKKWGLGWEEGIKLNMIKECMCMHLNVAMNTTNLFN